MWKPSNISRICCTRLQLVHREITWFYLRLLEVLFRGAENPDGLDVVLARAVW